MTDVLSANLLSPIPLAFALGIAARLLRSEFSLPKDLYTSLSIYLLFALGLKGGAELAHASMAAIAAFLMLSGVSKSGSPTESEMMSRPAFLRSRAFCVATMVADGFTRVTAPARNDIFCSKR